MSNTIYDGETAGDTHFGLANAEGKLWAIVGIGSVLSSSKRRRLSRINHEPNSS